MLIFHGKRERIGEERERVEFVESASPSETHTHTHKVRVKAKVCSCAYVGSCIYCVCKKGSDYDSKLNTHQQRTSRDYMSLLSICYIMFNKKSGGLQSLRRTGGNPRVKWFISREQREFVLSNTTAAEQRC